MSSEAARKGGGAVSARDELAADVQAVFDAKFATSLDVADALLAAGWRKMPSRAALTRHLANAEVILNTTDAQWEQPNVVEAERMAEAILALMERGSA